jgi:hypothetical protein
MTGSKMTVAVLAGANGSQSFLENQLYSLGIEPDEALIPADMVVTHTGSLVGEGGQSDYCVSLASELMDRNPGRFYTLWGSGDVAALSSGGHGVSKEVFTWLSKQWERATLPVAVALDTPGGFIVVSHAGVSPELWGYLGSPDYQDCCENLNTLVGSQNKLILTPQTPSPSADNLDKDPSLPGFAVPTAELLIAWLEYADYRPMPFMQVYATADTVADWNSSRAKTATPDRLKRTSVVDTATRRCYTLVDLGARLIGLSQSAPPPEPLIFKDTWATTGIQDSSRPRRWRYHGPR